MSFIAHAAGAPLDFFGLRHAGHAVTTSLDPSKPPAPPAPPNPNDAANAAQSLTDQMRMRRGLLSNIYAGDQTGKAAQPVVGATQLGQ